MDIDDIHYSTELQMVGHGLLPVQISKNQCQSIHVNEKITYNPPPTNSMQPTVTTLKKTSPAYLNAPTV